MSTMIHIPPPPVLPPSKKKLSRKQKWLIGGGSAFMFFAAIGAIASPPPPVPDTKPIAEQPKAEEPKELPPVEEPKAEEPKQVEEPPVPEAPEPEPSTDPGEFKMSSSLEFDFLASSMERYPALADVDAQTLLDAGYQACADLNDGATQEEAAAASGLPAEFIYFANGYMCYSLTD